MNYSSIEKAIEPIFKINYVEFSNFVEIGQGGFGKVDKCWWADFKCHVALKSLKTDSNTEFIRELEILKKLKNFSFHPNIIEFYGIAQNPSGGYSMVLQFADNGNLREYLKKKFSRLGILDKLHFAREITLGLVFLHKKNIIHRDLHTKNILVHKGHMKIADFGHSSHITNPVDQICGIPAFIDPESLSDFSYKPTKKTDVYGLGVIFWEISSGRPPFENSTPNEIINLILQGKREIPIDCMPTNYVELYKRCWDKLPTNRPETKTVLDDLNKIIYNYGNSHINDKIPQETKFARNDLIKIIPDNSDFSNNSHEIRMTNSQNGIYHNSDSLDKLYKIEIVPHQ